ncbi:MAG: biotin--[acetyl-CoA-carboxylase] ligase [Planctomycetota bacterium]
MSRDGAGASDLTAEAVSLHLRTQRLGQALVLLEETDSTNDEVWRRVQAGAPPGLVVVARHQTAGRGRQGRSWIDRPDRSLLCSIALRPESERYWMAGLPLAAGIAACDAVREISGSPVQLKWPNDLLIEGRKLAGILIEAKSLEGFGRLVIVGIGMNVGAIEGELPAEVGRRAVSLEAVGGRAVDRSKLLAAILIGFERELVRIAADERRAIADRWLERAAPLPERVIVRRGKETLEGRPIRLDPLEGITIAQENGEIVTVPPPEIELLD